MLHRHLSFSVLTDTIFVWIWLSPNRLPCIQIHTSLYTMRSLTLSKATVYLGLVTHVYINSPVWHSTTTPSILVWIHLSYSLMSTVHFQLLVVLSQILGIFASNSCESYQQLSLIYYSWRLSFPSKLGIFSLLSKMLYISYVLVILLYHFCPWKQKDIWGSWSIQWVLSYSLVSLLYKQARHSSRHCGCRGNWLVVPSSNAYWVHNTIWDNLQVVGVATGPSSVKNDVSCSRLFLPS